MKQSVAVTEVLAMLACGAASAQVGSGVIYACVGSSGAVQIVAAGTACKKNETALNWNATGPTGAPGPRGPSNVMVADNLAAATAILSTDASRPTRVVALQLPAGNYVLNGIVGLTAAISPGTLVPFANVSCRLTDGTGPVSAGFSMLLGEKTTSHASIPVAGAITLTSADAVGIDCVTQNASGVEISTQPSVLTAIQVDALSVP